MTQQHTSSIQGVVFDMDGVLFESESIYFGALRDLLSEAGKNLTEAEYYANLAGFTNPEAIANLQEMYGAEFDTSQLLEEFEELAHHRLYSLPLTPLPGVVEALHYLQKLELKLAVASSGAIDVVNRCLDHCGLSDFFPIRAGGDEVTRGKPDPAVYQLACKRLGLAPQSCLAIEDTAAGQRAAQAAGMRVICACPGADESVPKLQLPTGLRVSSLEQVTPDQWSSLLSK